MASDPLRIYPRRGRAVAGRDYVKCKGTCGGRIVRKDAVDKDGKCGACGKAQPSFGRIPYLDRKGRA